MPKDSTQKVRNINHEMGRHAKTFEWVMSRIIRLENGCWSYPRVPSGGGYTQIDFGGKRYTGHCLLYERLKGPIPTGLELDHKCRNPACINPDHVEPVTHRENLRRAAPFRKPKPPPPPKPPRVWSEWTHCVRGHAYTESNTVYRGKKQAKHCRQCEKLRFDSWKRRRLYGIPCPRRKLTNEQRAQLLREFPHGGSMRAWGRKLGVHHLTIRRELQRPK